MRNGTWFVEPPQSHESTFGAARSFESLDAIFDLQKRDASTYIRHIESTLTKLSESGRKFGALILEPVILGAGGMHFM